MVQVHNLVDTAAERSGMAVPLDKMAPSALHDQAHALMREQPLHGKAMTHAEPSHIDFNHFSNPYAGCGDKAPKPMTQAEKNFRPDYVGGGSREWQQKSHEQNSKGIELNKDGKYEVQPGDTLNSIATRSLRADGHNPSQAEIQKRTKELEQLNTDQFGNRDLVKPGMTLKLQPGPEDLECRRPDAGAGSSNNDATLPPAANGQTNDGGTAGTSQGQSRGDSTHGTGKAHGGTEKYHGPAGAGQSYGVFPSYGADAVGRVAPQSSGISTGGFENITNSPDYVPRSQR